MSRRRRKVDSNQPAITAALRELGVSVTPTHMVGNGFPDLVLGLEGHNFLVELKTKGGRLTEDELQWQQDWGGQFLVAQELSEILRPLYALAKERYLGDPRLYGTLEELLYVVEEVWGHDR